MENDDKEFNPFYDSDFLISHEDSSERRFLVEMHTDELVQLRNEIDIVLKGREKPMDIGTTEKQLLKSQSLEEFDQLLQGVDIQAAKGIIKKLVSRLNVLCLEKILDVANEDFDVVEFMQRISEERSKANLIKEKLCI